MKTRSHAQGFTLLEVLIAVVILAMILYIIQEVFFRTATSSEEVSSGNVVYQRARTALMRMTSEIEQAYWVSRRRANFTTFVGIDREQKGFARDILHFTATSHERLAPDAKESDLCELSYFLFDDPETGKTVLLHREDANPDEEKLSGGIVYELAEDVIALDFAYYDGEQWQTEWDAGESGLPYAVRIALTLADAEGKPHTFFATAQILRALSR